MSIVAVDFGGTNIKAGVVDGGAVGELKSIDGHSKLGVAQALPRLADLIRGFDLSAVTGVGVALPTLVDARTSRILMTMKGKYEGLHQVDFPAWAAREFGLPIRLDNDAHAAILGEWRFGAGVGSDNLVMVTLGTGIGSSVIIDGKPLRGRHAQAGNLGGHFVIEPNGFPCVCGARGCVEAQQHLDSVARIAQADPRYPGSPLSKGKFDYKTIFAESKGDALSRELRDRTLAIWGTMLISLIHQFDCDRIVVGGGIMNSADDILPALKACADSACTPWGKVDVRPAALGDAAGLVGLQVALTEPLQFI
jgi:glucokinase